MDRIPLAVREELLERARLGDCEAWMAETIDLVNAREGIPEEQPTTLPDEARRLLGNLGIADHLIELAIDAVEGRIPTHQSLQQLEVAHAENELETERRKNRERQQKSRFLRTINPPREVGEPSDALLKLRQAARERQARHRAALRQEQRAAYNAAEERAHPGAAGRGASDTGSDLGAQPAPPGGGA